MKHLKIFKNWYFIKHHFQNSKEALILKHYSSWITKNGTWFRFYFFPTLVEISLRC